MPDRAKFLIDRKIALLKSLDLLDDGTMQTAVKWMGPVFSINIFQFAFSLDRKLSSKILRTKNYQ